MSKKGTKGGSVSKNIAWSIYALILLAVLALIWWQIYRVSTGQAWSYGQPTTTEESVEVAQDNPDDIDLADTPQVQELAGMQRIENSSLGGDDNSVTFRTQSGSIICTISKDLQKYPVSDWIPRGVTPKGEPLSGPGVSCAPYHYHQLVADDVQKCDGGYTVGVSFATTDNAPKAPGACQSERPRIQRYVEQMEAGNLQEKVLPPNFRAQVGNYACQVDSLSVTCANMTTGKGFTFNEESYKYF